MQGAQQLPPSRASAPDARKDADSQATAEKSPPSVGRPAEGHRGWVNRDTSPACD